MLRERRGIRGGKAPAGSRAWNKLRRRRILKAIRRRWNLEAWERRIGSCMKPGPHPDRFRSNVKVRSLMLDPIHA